MFFTAAHAGTLPIQGSSVAGGWDDLYSFLLWLSVVFFVLVVGGMIVFAIKYRAGVHPRSKYIRDHHVLEAIWTVVPTILLMVIFAWGYVVYDRMVRAPSDAMEIRVIAKQWLWQFQYDNGRTTVGELYVPLNKPVKLLMTSTDVLHSFFIPNFRVKQDVVPGMYTSVWFEATVPGKHQVFCTEYCGTSHSEMLAQTIVLDDEQWEQWLKNRPLGAIPRAEEGLQLAGLAARGRELVQAKGCAACHTADGSTKMGPSFKGVWGHEVELVDGSKARVDENYIRESIQNPQAKLVKGFNPVMPTFQGLLNDEEINSVIAYIQALR